MEDILGLILDKNNPRYLELQSSIDQYQQKYDSALSFYNAYINDHRGTENKKKLQKILSEKAEVCYLTHKYFEFEETIYEAMNLQKKSDYVLRLGYVYLQRQAWLDAVSTFKLAIKLQDNSALSYLGIGIGYLKSQEFALSEENL